MSLATRCTSCKTVFRVVQDQLKVSEGWVRCGRCGTVFNALEALFDLERDIPAKWQTSQTGSLDPKKSRDASRGKSRREGGSGSGNHTSSGGTHSRSGSRKAVDEPVAYTRRRSDAPPTEPPPSEPKSSHGHSDFADAQFDPDLVAHLSMPPVPPPPEVVPPPRSRVAEPVPVASSPAPVAAPTPDMAMAMAMADTVIAGTEAPAHADMGEGYEPATLEFVRLAERQAHWQQPRVRLMLAGGGAALALLLLLQVAHHFRDITAARWPSTAPMLVRWCQTFQCQVQAPRHIDSVVVESINLTRTPNSTDTFLLSVALRNKSPFAVALPALDLSLRDANGLLITRRMLKPQDLHSKVNVIEPDAETQVQVTLKEKGQRIVGYTVEAFYP
ncbi:MAG: DUF3426 domain-containing protein [Pseudomonadota bacterium]